MRSQNPDRLVCSFGSAILQKHLESIKSEIDGVRQALDIEYIHRMRVATRRFRNALAVFSACYPGKKYLHWQKQVRSITRALGAARDVDVQIHHIEGIFNQTEDRKLRPGLKRLLLRLRQSREKLQRDILPALDAFVRSGVVDDISRALQKRGLPEEPGRPHPSSLYVLGHSLINSRLDDLFAFEPFIRRPECKEELHAMRIAAKHLRYTLEIFSPIYPDTLDSYIDKTRKMQEFLGEIHDRDVWLDFLPRFIETETRRAIKYYGSRRAMAAITPGILHLENIEQSLRDGLYQGFLSAWGKWEAAHVWQKLRGEISLPLPPAQIYPPSLPISAPPPESAG